MTKSNGKLARIRNAIILGALVLASGLEQASCKVAAMSLPGMYIINSVDLTLDVPGSPRQKRTLECKQSDNITHNGKPVVFHNCDLAYFQWNDSYRNNIDGAAFAISGGTDHMAGRSTAFVLWGNSVYPKQPEKDNPMYISASDYQKITKLISDEFARVGAKVSFPDQTRSLNIVPDYASVPQGHEAISQNNEAAIAIEQADKSR